MFKSKHFHFSFVILTILLIAGCGNQSEETAQEAVPATTTPANPNTNTGLASSKQDLKNRAQASSQSTESPVGAAKTNTE